MTRTKPGGTRMTGRYLAIGIAGVAVAAVVAACSGGASGSGGGSSAASSSSPSASASSSTARGAGGQRGPAASGKIAAVEAGSIEVQSSTAGQLTVDYTASTKITQTLTGTKADITVGSCIVAVDASSTAGSSPTTIAVSPAVNGSCTRVGGFGGGTARPSGGNFTPGANRPSGFPSGRPSGLRTGSNLGGANFANAITTGKVTALSGSTITVAAVSFNRTTTPSAAASPSTTTKTITVGSTTKITKDATVTSTALKVGLCASAQGTADTTGAVAATSIALTSPDTTGSCETGFGRFGQGGAGFGAEASGSNG